MREIFGSWPRWCLLGAVLLGALVPAAQAAAKPVTLARAPAKSAAQPLTAVDRQVLGSLRAPMLNPVVTSPFGSRLNPVRRVRAFHEGVDYGAPSGTPVYAAQGGSIVALDRTAHSGLYMRLRHSSGVETFYGHLSRTMPGLKAGGAIRAGDVIGFVGESGFATGPHLHYEVLVNGRPIDPDSSRYLARMVSLR